MKKKSSARVVLVTGATSGIGKATATYLQQNNFKVFGSSRNPSGKRSSFPLVKLDVTCPQSVEGAVSQVISEAGRIDILVNNAGVGITGPVEETPEEEIKKAFETNYFGPVNMIKAVLPGMRKNKSGLIINITSLAGYMGLPYRGIYSASKSALEITTEAWRMELRDFHIKMTNLAPGDFATNIAAGRYHAPVQEHSPYKRNYANTLNLMNKHVDAGQEPELVAREVLKIIWTKEPAIHYIVGERLQKFSVFLKRVLPDKTYEKLLLRHYKL